MGKATTGSGKPGDGRPALGDAPGLRILIVALNYAPELVGCAKYTTELAEDLSTRGHAVEVVCGPPYYPQWKVETGYSGGRWSRETRNGVTLHRTPLYVPARPSGARRVAHLASFGLAAIGPALTVARRFRPDLVLAIAPALTAAGAALLAAKAAGAMAWDWVAPYWAPRLSKIVKIGTHIFYRWNGAWGLPTAFTGVYSGAEPIVAKMVGLASIAVESPAEVMTVAEFTPLPLEEDRARLSPLIAAPVASQSQEFGAGDAVEVALAAAAPVRAAPVLQRDVPIMADPLVSPTAPPVRQRQRIAAPSGW